MDSGYVEVQSALGIMWLVVVYLFFNKIETFSYLIFLNRKINLPADKINGNIQTIFHKWVYAYNTVRTV